MRWGKDWRKLYRYPSRQWLNLPAQVRGLGDELIRVADDDGRIYVGADAVTGAMRAIEAQRTERRWITSALATLLRPDAEGKAFVFVDGEYLVIRNFPVAQGAVSPSGERMRKLRAKGQRGDGPDDRGDRHGDAPRATAPEPECDRRGTDVVPGCDRSDTGVEPVSGASPRNESTRPVTVTGEEKRQDQKRVCAARAREPDPDPSDAAATLALVERWAAESGGRFSSAGAAPWLLPLAALVREARAKGYGPELEAFGRWAHRVHGDGFRWMNRGRPRAQLLVDNFGAQFWRALDDCRDWRAAQRPPAPVVPIARAAAPAAPPPKEQARALREAMAAHGLGPRSTTPAPPPAEPADDGKVRDAG